MRGKKQKMSKEKLQKAGELLIRTLSNKRGMKKDLHAYISN